MSALGMVLILHALGVLVCLALIAFGTVSIIIIEETYDETKRNKDKLNRTT